MFTPVLDWAWDGPALGSAEADKARLLLLDSLGCALAGLSHARPRAMAAALAPAFPGALRLPGCPALGPAGAAAVLAAAMCWDETNDGLSRAHGRPGLAVAPLALAALAGGARLDEALAAYALGYEVAARAGEAWRIRPGMHVDGSWHSLGAAAAAVRLAGGDRQAAGRAVRLAACQIPFTLYAPIGAGMDGRNTYPAHAVLLGHMTAAAALAGMDAPEAGFGIARGLALGLDSPMPCEPPGVWLLGEAYLKPFAGVRHAHYAAAAALALRPRVGDVRDIASITLHTYAEALHYAGNRAPAAPIAAQFSLSWAVAAALLLGHLGPAAFAAEALADPAIRQLEARIVLAEESALTSSGRRGARLVVRLADGREEQETVTGVTGDPDRPMSPDEAADKFKRYAAPTLGEAGAAAACAAMLGPPAARPGALLFGA